MMNRLDNIATRQRQSRLRDRVFVAAIALVTTLTIGSVAFGASMSAPADPTAQTTQIASR